MPIKAVNAFMLLAFIFTTALFAGDPKLKDYPKAQELEQRAENGDKQAMYDLAVFYDAKFNDEKKAIYWLEKNYGKKCDKECALDIGRTYFHNYNYERGRVWLKKAYKMGSADAAFILGIMITGEEEDSRALMTDEDYKLAVKYLESAHKMGNKDAAFELGEITKDVSKSIEWYKIAYKQGRKDAVYKIAYSCDDKKEAIKWYEKAYRIGFNDAAHQLARYYEGLKDYSNAIKWYEIDYNASISKGYKSEAANTAYELGRAYRDYKDYPNAIKWYEIAYNGGDSAAAFALGQLYDFELKDYPNAIKWYQTDNSDFGRKKLDELNKKLSQELNSTIPTDLNSSK
jgi:TPR repeat protein